VHDPLPVRNFILFYGKALSQYAGVVDQAVQASEFLLDTVDQRRIRVTVGGRKVKDRDRDS